MRNHEIGGYWTCRNFRDSADATGNTDALLAAEGELFLFVADDNSVRGTLAFPALPLADITRIMDVAGMVSAGEPRILTLRAIGRARTDLAGVAYDFTCVPAATWTIASHPQAAQRPTLVGTATLVAPQADATGATTSVVAVKRDFHEPRDIPGVALIPEVVQLLASPRHRLQHAAWHLVRNSWMRLGEDVRGRVGQLDWAVPDGRIPLDDRGRVVLGTGAGEDFLFMHRRMIGLVREMYAKAGKEPIQGWTTLPTPGAPQYAYREIPDPRDPAKVIHRFDAGASGFMTPPPWDDDAVWPKSAAFFNAMLNPVARRWNPQFEPTAQRLLASLSLGDLGNLLEFTVHNWMHNRWASGWRNPTTGERGTRGRAEFGGEWDNPSYDYLGEFYSSHVNPVFWRLHGWVDDRIEDWFEAHQMAHEGAVVRQVVRGTPWFATGAWVQLADPWEGSPALADHHEHHHDTQAEEATRMVIRIIDDALTRQQSAAGFAAPAPRAMRMDFPV